MAGNPRRQGRRDRKREPRDAEPLPIVKGADEPVLRTPAQPVAKVNREVRQLLDRMAATMYAADGIGLAAPQVGVSKRIVVVDVGDGLIELINPEIVRRGEETETAYEGCLSLPRLLAEVERPATVQVTALDRHGRRIWIEGEGLLARCLQHEIDHLDGVLITDRARKVVELPPESDLRVVFMGTPSFAVPSLEELLQRHVRVVGVVTQPDRPQGRGLAPAAPPVKALAEENGIPVLQPERLDDAVVEQLRAWRPDLLVVVAYGKILPPAVLAVPRLGAINVHASLLPRHRGAAPIQRAILAGDRVTGVTTMWMDEGLDTGDVILQKEIPLDEEITAGQLHDRLARLGAQLLGDTLRLVAEGKAPRRPQDPAQATVAPKLAPEEEWVDWNRPAAEVARQIRALDPRPGARTTWRGQVLKVYGATAAPPRQAGGAAGAGEGAGVGEPEPPGGPGAAGEAAASGGPVRPGAGSEPAPPGTIVALTPDAAAVRCREGVVWIRRLQPAGRRPLTPLEMLNGYRLAVGERLGEPQAGPSPAPAGSSGEKAVEAGGR
ncbi:methionyl-tRNA formyltransferase [Thermaerobacter marianensis DSM 12885]|uniref:Multifunctional fusion protein n=1 Tax=Thermaerobacter marianensis (strain ATCC 700841 / DSM 12885 / JCM 10246 / 7p75a) TaxID=644966 RepID=E6SJA4_THEM7|nr:methionyl-tRNA formyltransferase [Thermaerobacter marianensis]ADU51032.1 methionyl-tRNA formyltransferase [Thermaerobacter marianensis DSM 12885]